jgi:GNAT superfamily N-acetyltransferase
MMNATKVNFRHTVQQADAENVRELIDSTGFFSKAEADVAVELVDERLSKGLASGYHFLFAEIDGRTIGYTCYGPIACTISSYDLYWIAVHNEVRGKGVGKLLLLESEKRIQNLGGSRIYIETSNKQQYEPTRGFYLNCGYKIEAILDHFYGPSDGKVIYVKAVQ